MKLTTRTRYGARALLDLAIHGDGKSTVRLKDIAARQEISLAYLEHIVASLVDAGIVRTVRGAKGGISLARPAREITLKEVVKVLEGSTELADCLSGSKSCPRSGFCATQDIWSEMGAAINGVLAATSLQDLVERQAGKGVPLNMYHI